jgi:hypothetical protein
MRAVARRFRKRRTGDTCFAIGKSSAVTCAALMVNKAGSAFVRQRDLPSEIGYWRFSPPGFRVDCREAVVFVTKVCGPQCGFEAFFTLGLEADRWHITQQKIMINL